VSVDGDREVTLGAISSAFARKDHDAVLAAMSDDIEIVVPGDTLFAGTYAGKSEALRWLLQLRDAFVPDKQPAVTFSHGGNDMIVRHQMSLVDGGRWMNIFRVTFNGPLIERIVWEPEDMETFDALIARVIDGG
jgi:hypothetical protein